MKFLAIQCTFDKRRELYTQQLWPYMVY